MKLHKRKLLPLLTIVVGLLTASHAAVPRSKHVIIVAEENHSFEDVFRSGSMPWLAGMASRYAVAVNSYANAHYSIPNYMWLTAGRAVTFDDNTHSSFNTDNIVRYLLTAGLTWKEYAQGLPYAGYTGYNAGFYVKRHNPFAYFTDVAKSSERFNMVPFTRFAEDLKAGTLPNFAFVTPDVWHDAHNGSLRQADQWLQTNIAPVLKTAAFQPGGDGVLIITFDESHDSDCRPNPRCRPLPGNVGGGKIATVFIGPGVKRGYRSTALYLEQNVLRTVLDLLGIQGGPGLSRLARPMSDMFR